MTNSSGSGDTYVGNVGSPYGTNIQEVSASEASSYKYVVEFQGSNTEDWKVVIWNKIGPDGKMDGWYNNACHSFTIAAGATKYYAFDADSQGGWTASKGSIPLNEYGSYASTWVNSTSALLPMMAGLASTSPLFRPRTPVSPSRV